MGYDSGILIDATHPQWPFKEGYSDFRDRWKQEHNPVNWMGNSCVWYSQVLTKRLGITKFYEHVKKFSYGNMDVSGDKGTDNGLTNSWLSSSLEISTEEQVTFIKKLVDNKLPVSLHSHEMTKSILFIEELPNGWKLYGKTGSGNLLSQDRTIKLETQHGWFVGWIEKGNKIIVFASHITDDNNKKEDLSAGKRAQSDAKEKLIKIIDAHKK